MSPSNKLFRYYCRIYPGLLNHMALNRIAAWSDAALETVSHTYVKEHLSIRDELVEPIDKHVVHVHKSVQFYSNQFNDKLHRKNFLTLRNLMDYIHTYLKLIGTCMLLINFFSRAIFASHPLRIQTIQPSNILPLPWINNNNNNKKNPRLSFRW